MYDHAMESMDSTCSNIDYVYAVSSKIKSWWSNTLLFN
jgi:hypothetical protein